MFNDGLKLRRMITYLVNKKTQYSLNVVNNTGAQNLITLIAKFQKPARTSNLLTKVKFNIENLKIIGRGPVVDENSGNQESGQNEEEIDSAPAQRQGLNHLS